MDLEERKNAIEELKSISRYDWFCEADVVSRGTARGSKFVTIVRANRKKSYYTVKIYISRKLQREVFPNTQFLSACWDKETNKLAFFERYGNDYTPGLACFSMPIKITDKRLNIIPCFCATRLFNGLGLRHPEKTVRVAAVAEEIEIHGRKMKAVVISIPEEMLNEV